MIVGQLAQSLVDRSEQRLPAGHTVCLQFRVRSQPIHAESVVVRVAIDAEGRVLRVQEAGVLARRRVWPVADRIGQRHRGRDVPPHRPLERDLSAQVREIVFRQCELDQVAQRRLARGHVIGR